ncbi:MAG TPA: hypothetical protein DCF33_04230 [Saprospirales bacterium]|nr:hypothetical protein [Saprospirales bacterium]
MKKILVFVLFLSLGVTTHAATWYVSTNGNDNNAGTLTDPFKTLPRAIDEAQPGDEILLRGGQYTSLEIRINKSNLHIKSYPGEWAVITAVTNVEDISSCIWYNEPETTGGSLERLEIIGGYYYAVKFETNWDWDPNVPFNQRKGVSGVTIKDCNIHHTGRDAIKLTPACANITILNCEIHHTGAGPGALLDFNAEGIDNVNAPNLTVKGCYIHDIATTGVYVKGGGRNCIIEANRIENCGEGGIYLGFYTDAEWFDTDFNPEYYENINGLVINNLVVNTQHAGIGLWGAKDARVYNNTIINAALTEHAALFFNTTDVWIDDVTSARVGSRNVRVVNNLFVQPGTQEPVMVRVRENALNGNNNQIDNNGYYDPAGTTFLDDNLDWEEWSLAQWKAQTFRDLHSFDADPQMDGSHHLLAGSPCINTGVNQPFITTDREGQPRTDGANDIGSDELGIVGVQEEASVKIDYTLQILGHPVSNELMLRVESTRDQVLSTSIRTLNGKMLLAEKWHITPGENTKTLLISQLPAGVYILQAGSWNQFFLKQ